MWILRWAYMQLHVFIKGHLPLGTLVRFYWKSPGVPMINAIGLVIGGWKKWKHPMPPGVIVSGSVVLFDLEQYDMENWELEVIE